MRILVLLLLLVVSVLAAANASSGVTAASMVDEAIALQAVATLDGAPVPMAAVSVRPEPTTKTAYLGQVFSLPIYIYAGSNHVNAADIHIAFNPAYLQVTGIRAGSGLPTVNGSTYNNGAGTIDFGAMKPGGYSTGTIGLCTISFRSTGLTSGTNLTNRSGPLVVAPGGSPLSSSWSNGTIVIQPAPQPTATPTLVPGGVCVSVYQELRGDFQREPDEPLLAGALVRVANLQETAVAEYTTDGVNEPHCIQLSANETYKLLVSSPPGYVGWGPQAAYLVSSSGVNWDLDFGQVPAGETTATPTVSATPTMTTTGPAETATPTATPTVSPTPTTETVSVIIDPQIGGQLVLPDGSITIGIPPGATRGTTTFTLTLLGIGVGPLGEPLPLDSMNRIVACGRSFRLTARSLDGQEVRTFEVPITLTRCCQATMGDDAEERLALFRWDPALRVWQVMPSSAGRERYCLVAPIDEPGTFALGWPGTGLCLPLILRSATTTGLDANSTASVGSGSDSY
jgi:hypothetical protein